jgi:hypothetical protein
LKIHTFYVQLLITMSILLLTLVTVIAKVQATSMVHEPQMQYIVVINPTIRNAVNAASLNEHGHHVVKDLSQAGIFVVNSSDPTDLKKLPGVISIAKDHPTRFLAGETQKIMKSDTIVADTKETNGEGCASIKASCPLQWDLERIHVPSAWKTTQGNSAVKVAVLDTGVTSTHEAVGSNYDYAASTSFVQPNAYCPADANTYRSTEDFYGHGTFTSLHIAGKNGKLMTGIAPKTTLINVRVVGACGYASDSWILEGMLYANQIGASIVSLSLATSVCGLGVVPGSSQCDSQENVGDGPAIYRAYQQVVSYLRAHGTIVIAAAANNHVRINQEGMVTSHGSLAGPDFYGTTITPGGIPGVFTVAALNRVTMPGSANETRYGQFGIGRADQLAASSNYGEPIAISAPGGSSNYNVPPSDCLTANCVRTAPSVPGATDNPGVFGAWGVDASGQPCNSCYVYGTAHL